MRSSTRADASEGSRPPSRARTGKVKHADYKRSTSFPKEVSPRKSSPHLGTLNATQEHIPSSSSPRPYPLAHAHTDSDVRPRTATPLELPTAIVVVGLEHTTIAQQKALDRVFAKREVVLRGYNAGGNELQPQLERSESGTWKLPEGFIMIYVSPWNTQERPAIYKNLVGTFPFI
jgi:hypothetical protein